MRIKKLLLKALAVLVVLTFLGIILFVVLINISLPKDNGELSCSSLKAEVNIYKDNWGVAHIQASNQHDAIFAYGYTVAKDRLFQMDLQRRVAQGRLAEILGDDLIEIDMMFRRYLFKDWAQNYLANTTIDSEALAYVDAYLEGINSYIETGPKPFEYHLIGAEIDPFTRLDVSSMIAYMAFTFMDGIRFDGLYSILKEKVGENNIHILFPDYADNNSLTIKEEKVPSIPKRNYTKDTTHLLLDSINQLAYFFNLNDQVNRWNPPFHGSNSWILASSRTNNGMPILANDPHIGISKPDVWYEAHVSYPGYNNYGYYVPMIPFPLIGHDDFKAWGLTMFENDELDLYKETFHSEKENLVLFDNQWVEHKTIAETIYSKSNKDNTINIKVTANGPIVSDNIPYYKGDPLSMFWVFYQNENPIFDILYNLSQSNDMKSFEENLSRVVSPGLNFSYIDTTGNIAWWASGKIPYRHPDVNAKQILDGNNPRHQVLSYVPFKDNPQLVNPSSGVIVTANNLSTIDSVGGIPRLDGYFRSTDRAERILELLNSKETWSTEQLQQVQTDVKLWSGPKMKKALCAALQLSEDQFTDTERTAFETLTNWDASMSTSSVGVSIFMFTNYHIMKNLLSNQLDDELLKHYLNCIDHWDFIRNFLFNKTVPFTTDNSYENCVFQGFKAALKELNFKYGGNQSNWNWGAIHTIEFEHPLGKQQPLNKLFNLGPFGVNGGFNAVNKIMSHQGDHNYKVSSLPSTRRLINIGVPENTYSILPSGNSGHFQSDHYDDQLELFLNGVFRKLNFTDKQVEQQKESHYKLLPSKVR